MKRLKDIRIPHRLIAVLAISSALAAIDAPAHASAPKFQMAEFKLSIEGKQTTTVANSHDPLNQCDTRNYSHGREVVSFETERPIKLTLFKTGRNPQLSALYGKRKPAVPTVARINRSYTHDITMPDPVQCPPPGGGGGNPKPPDCGKRTFRPWEMALEFPKAGRVGLEAGYVGKDLYKRCGGGAFPELLAETTGGNRILAQLPHGEVFDEKIGKLITIGRGTRDYVLHDYDETTRVRWELTLRRIG